MGCAARLMCRDIWVRKMKTGRDFPACVLSSHSGRAVFFEGYGPGFA